METMWKAIIQDMLDAGLTPEEIKNQLRERYPESPELVAYVDHLVSSTVLGFCKKAQFKEGDPDWWRSEEGAKGGQNWKGKWLEEFLRFIRFWKKGEPIPGATLSVVASLWKMWADGKMEDSLSDLRNKGVAEKVQDRILTLYYTRLNQLQPEAIEMAESELRGSDIPSAKELGEMFKFERLRGFCKKAQVGVGFGYGNEGQTNFSVPNSEGEVGSGNPIDPTSATTPSSSYTDHVRHRIKLRREQEGEQERRKKRKQLLEEMKKAQVRPGDLLRPDRPRTQNPMQEITENMVWKNRARDISKPVPVVPEPKETPTTPVQVGPDKMEKTVENTKKIMDSTKKTREEMKKTVDEGMESAKELGKLTDETTKSVKDLQKSLENLVRP